MPVIDIKVGRKKTSQNAKEIRDNVLNLTIQIFKKKRELAAVIIDFA